MSKFDINLRVVFFAVLCLCSSIFAAESVYSKAVPTKPTYGSSFYASGAVGFGFEYQYYHWDNKERHREFDYWGVSNIEDIKLGVLIKQLFAVHALVSVSVSEGEFDSKVDSTTYSDIRGSSMFVGFGPGLTIYPFRGKGTILADSYVGIGLQMGIQFNSVNGYYGQGRIGDMWHDMWAFGWSCEVGKEWQLAKRLYVGAALKFKFNAIVGKDDCVGDDQCPDNGHYTSSLHAAVTLTRK